MRTSDDDGCTISNDCSVSDNNCRACDDNDGCCNDNDGCVGVRVKRPQCVKRWLDARGAQLQLDGRAPRLCGADAAGGAEKRANERDRGRTRT